MLETLRGLGTCNLRSISLFPYQEYFLNSADDNAERPIWIASSQCSTFSSLLPLSRARHSFSLHLVSPFVLSRREGEREGGRVRYVAILGLFVEAVRQPEREGGRGREGRHRAGKPPGYLQGGSMILQLKMSGIHKFIGAGGVGENPPTL